VVCVLATRASLALLLTLPLLVLVGVVDSHPEVIVVLSVGCAVHLLCLLASNRPCSERLYLPLAGAFLLLGVLAAALVSLRLGHDLSKSFALIFGVVVAAMPSTPFACGRLSGCLRASGLGCRFRQGCSSTICSPNKCLCSEI
jgi:hypothetical protein